MGATRILASFALIALSGAASAQTTTHKEGEYGGVTPGVVAPYEALPKKRMLWKNTSKNAVYWVGFLAKRNQVFIQTSEKPDYSGSMRDGKYVLRISGMRPVRGNWWRFIDTSFFEARIARIETNRYRKKRVDGETVPGGVEIVISFQKDQSPGEPEISYAALDDGFHYLMLSF